MYDILLAHQWTKMWIITFVIYLPIYLFTINYISIIFYYIFIISAIYYQLWCIDLFKIKPVSNFRSHYSLIYFTGEKDAFMLFIEIGGLPLSHAKTQLLGSRAQPPGSQQPCRAEDMASLFSRREISIPLALLRSHSSGKEEYYILVI